LSEPPASPVAARLGVPGWLDPRLALGVLLVLVSVVVGARVLSSADRSSLVFVAARDLEPGATVQTSDVVPQRVRLEPGQVGRLVPVPPDGRAPSGYVALRAVSAGDLLLRSALVDERSTELRQVTVDVTPGHAPPDLRSSQLVDVYVTPGESRGATGVQTGTAPTPAAGAAPRLVLAGVPVASAPPASSLGGQADAVVVLNVPPRDALTLVRAVAEGRIDLVRQLGRRASEPAVPLSGAAGSAAAAPGAPGLSLPLPGH
jgi:hypothetical protein